MVTVLIMSMVENVMTVRTILLEMEPSVPTAGFTAANSIVLMDVKKPLPVENVIHVRNITPVTGKHVSTTEPGVKPWSALASVKTMSMAANVHRVHASLKATASTANILGHYFKIHQK